MAIGKINKTVTQINNLLDEVENMSSIYATQTDVAQDIATAVAPLAEKDGNYPQMTVGVAQKIEMINNGQPAAVEIVNDADGLRLTTGGGATIDDIAYEGLTYRDIFETNNLLGITPNFANASYAPLLLTGTGELVQIEGEVGYAFKVSGSSSYVRKNSMSSPVYQAIRIRCDRYNSGYIGSMISGVYNEHWSTAINYVTEGFITSVKYVTSTMTDASFVGSFNSADLDGYVASPVFVSPDIFTTPPSEAEFKELYERYLTIAKTSEAEDIELATKKDVVADDVYVGVIMDATSADNRFYAMIELLDSAVGKRNGEVDGNVTLAESGCVCLLPRGNTAMYEGFPFEMLYSKNENVVTGPASTTKVWAIACALDWLKDINEKITIKSYDVRSGEPVLAEGDVLTVKDLLYGMMLPSSNTCANALARLAGYKILYDTNAADADAFNAFIGYMNRKAADIGMANTNFTTSSGLTNERTTTAKDMMLATVECCAYPELLRAWNKDTYTIEVGGSNPRNIVVTPSASAAKSELEAKYHILGIKTGSLWYSADEIYNALVIVAKPKTTE